MKNNTRALKISCYTGYFVQAIINNLLPLFFVLLQDNYKISYSELGTIVLINFLSQLIVDAASIKIIAVIGTKRAVLIAHILAAAGLILLSFLPYILPSVFLGLVICVITYAIGSGFIEVVISPIIDRITDDKNGGEMSLLHSFYCSGQAVTVEVTTIALRLFGTSWKIIPLFWAIVPIVNFFFFKSADIPEINTPRDENKGKFKFCKEYFIFLFMMLSAGASEIAMSQWASTFAERGLGVNKTVGDFVGPCAFAVFMAAGRLLYGFYSERLHLYRTMALCSALCIVCYLVTAVSGSGILSLVFCALCGFSVSIMWPAVFASAANRFENGGTVLFGTLAMAGDLGCASGPFIAGMLTDVGGFSLGFSVSAVFPLIMLVCSLYIMLYNRRNVYEA